MVNMQRQGADVYFDGFSKMKTFDFFNVASNWFLPYYGSHSFLAPLLEVLDGDDTFARSMENHFLSVMVTNTVSVLSWQVHCLVFCLHSNL